MPIVVNNINKVERVKSDVRSYNDLRKEAAPKPQAKSVTAPETRPAKQQNEHGDLIKPKYIEDKSVFYKSSGYLKDLLGEGN